VGSLAYSSIFPSTAVMINWHDQGRLTKVKESVAALITFCSIRDREAGSYFNCFYFLCFTMPWIA
jgi:hypothetical protein